MSDHLKIKPAANDGTTHDADEPLRLRLASGDETALSELMDRHMTKIFATAYRLLGDKMQAEDVTQMVFLKLWQIAPTWESGRATLLTYLYRVTNHRCLDILRKSKESLPGELPDMADQRPSAFDKISKTETSEQIKHALGELSNRQRAAISLFYYDHKSLKDAAYILDITPSAFESLLRRARAALKLHLTAEHSDDVSATPTVYNTAEPLT